MTRPAAVLFDRDDTLVEDVPYNGDPEKVRPMPGAREALDMLRRRGLRLGVVSNQSGIGRGLLTEAEVRAVNARVDSLLGPFDAWACCPHAPEDGCGCRKPAPGLVVEAARLLGVRPEDCVVIGDIGSDMDAARAAGARGVLVPTARTLPEEVASAPHVCEDLLSAVRHVLRDDPRRPRATPPRAAPGPVADGRTADGDAPAADHSVGGHAPAAGRAVGGHAVGGPMADGHAAADGHAQAAGRTADGHVAAGRRTADGHAAAGGRPV
ncbi:D-glycero-alpha-D-manno-heptose-1,7-bisphosphate 7-phosphatase [Streptomyces gobitricini]|uniref:D,D-heptose 1,7-bisphosphate phosphatase n=1 Tax=Streptomyces gobitricini TaxID=68211 RepID=A0ABP5ZEA8_9ACTN